MRKNQRKRVDRDRRKEAQRKFAGPAANAAPSKKNKEGLFKYALSPLTELKLDEGPKSSGKDLLSRCGKRKTRSKDPVVTNTFMEQRKRKDRRHYIRKYRYG